VRLRFWPASLGGRTALVLLVGLAVVQIAGLAIHALDRIDLLRLAQARDLGVRVMSIYRAVAIRPPEARAAAIGELDLPPGTQVRLEADQPPEALLPAPPPLQQLLRSNMRVIPLPPELRPTRIALFGHPGMVAVDMHLPDGPWLHIRTMLPLPRPWHSPSFLAAFLVMTVAAAALTMWAVRRLLAPVATLAAAAERLGRDVNADPLPEDGPTEVATAAAAFNTMAARIRRFVQDRTFMLTAIGHDLRTPITRLKLRAEFMEDEELRRKMLADLDELEAMVAATLTFGRDATSTEPLAPLDLAVLARTVLDEAADARPELAERLHYEGPEHLAVRARSMSLKRALANLVSNAIAYGGSARVTLSPPHEGTVQVDIEDDGPGIPPAEMDRIFQPFHRAEGSRNRETGGVGLGLPIARNILRAHGGDVTIANRPMGGARATVLLPA